VMDRGANVNIRDKTETGWTSLMWSALHGKLNLVGLLARAGANPSLLDINGQEMQTNAIAKAELTDILESNTRMMQAVKASKWEEVEVELSKGAWVNTKDNGKRNALMWAARTGRADAVNMLVAKGSQLDERDAQGRTAALFAVASRSIETAVVLLDQNADIGIRNHEGDNGLHIATRDDDAIMMQLLLLTEGRLEETDIEGHTPLMIAACAGHCRAAGTMLSYGANVHSKNHHNRTALMLAVVYGHRFVVQLMLEPLQPPPKFPQEGGEADVQDVKALIGGRVAESQVKTRGGKKKKKQSEAWEGEPDSPSGRSVEPKSPSSPTSPGFSKRKGAQKAAKAFVLTGADAEYADSLIRQLLQRRDEIMKQLHVHVHHHHMLKEVDKDGRAALQLAIINRHKDIVADLIYAKANVHKTDNKGNTTLHEAVLTAHDKVTVMLLDARVDINARNNEGKTAKDVAEDPHIKGVITTWEQKREARLMKEKQQAEKVQREKDRLSGKQK